MGPGSSATRPLSYTRAFRFCACALLALTASARATGAEPDLVVSELVVNEQCHPVVTLRNAGPGTMPTLAPGTGVSVQFIKGDAGFGGWTLLSAELTALREPGGTTTKEYPPLVEGDFWLTVSVDHGSVVAEADEDNNTLTRRVACNPALPDVAITDIQFTDDCHAVLRLENVGDGPLPPGLHAVSSGTPPSRIVRFDDGASVGDVALASIDSTRALRPPGGTLEWIDPRFAESRPNKTVRYEWTFRDPLRENELNTDNNSRQATFPPRCRPDLVVVDLAVDEECHVRATIRNDGPGRLPSVAHSSDCHERPAYQFVKDDAGFGGACLGRAQTAALDPTEGTTTVTSASAIRGTVDVSLRIDQYDRVAERNETNNVLQKSLSCGDEPPRSVELVPLAPTGATPPTRGPRPDLVVEDVALDRSCRVRITVRNRGASALPTTARPVYQMYKDGSAFGGSLLSPDQVRALSPPGARLTIGTRRTLAGSAEIRAVIDASERVVEAREDNNSLTKTLVCPSPTVPKLVPRRAPDTQSSPGPGQP